MLRFTCLETILSLQSWAWGGFQWTVLQNFECCIKPDLSNTLFLIRGQTGFSALWLTARNHFRPKKNIFIVWILGANLISRACYNEYVIISTYWKLKKHRRWNDCITMDSILQCLGHPPKKQEFILSMYIWSVFERFWTIDTRFLKWPMKMASEDRDSGISLPSCFNNVNKISKNLAKNAN